MGVGTDYLPTFAANVTGCAYAKSEEDFKRALEKVADPLAKLEQASASRASGPFFNGEAYALVDAAYAPFLQRYAFLDRIRAMSVRKVSKSDRLVCGLAGASSRTPIRRKNSRRCIGKLFAPDLSGFLNSADATRELLAGGEFKAM